MNLLEEMGGAEKYALSETNDIVRPMTVLRDGTLVWPAPAPAMPAPAAAATPHAAKANIFSEEHGPPARETMSGASRISLALVGLALLGIGLTAPPGFLAHFTVFVLACFIGYQVIWSVTPALHTPLMSVTNAISGIIVIGGMFQVGSGVAASVLGLLAILLATINISGGFLVTQRMLRMFHR